MRISSKVRYAARAMVELAKTKPDIPLPIQWIASKQEISPSYLEQLLAGMRKAGLVNSFKGPGGGYSLSRSPEEITLYNIFTALEGETGLIKGFQPKDVDCDRIEYCVMSIMWQRLQETIVHFLGNITLADIVEREKQLFEKIGTPKPRHVKRSSK